MASKMESSAIDVTFSSGKVPPVEHASVTPIGTEADQAPQHEPVRWSTPQAPQHHESARWNTDRLKEALGRSVAAQLAQGSRRVESQSDYNAVIVQGKPVNHVLHGVLTLFTIGFWSPVWIALHFAAGEKREMVTVDEYGNTSVQKL